MPINRKYPLSELLRACRDYPLRPRELLTFEYVLLGGFNDTDADAVRVATCCEECAPRSTLSLTIPAPSFLIAPRLSKESWPFSSS